MVEVWLMANLSGTVASVDGGGLIIINENGELIMMVDDG